MELSGIILTVVLSNRNHCKNCLNKREKACLSRIINMLMELCLHLLFYISGEITGESPQPNRKSHDDGDDSDNDVMEIAYEVSVMDL